MATTRDGNADFKFRTSERTASRTPLTRVVPRYARQYDRQSAEILSGGIAPFLPDFRQTVQSRRMLCNVQRKAIVARTDGAHFRHETWSL